MSTPSTTSTYRYYGTFDFISSASTYFSVVNVLPLGIYIRGVVPYELGSSYPEESTKAMAIIAATFAVYNEGRHSSYGFDVCTGQHCQVYRGIGTSGYRYESDKIVKCCDAVKGMVITYNKEPIQAVYHSSNGGFTENSENVWVATLPYLRSVEEKFEQTTEGATRGQLGIWTNTLTADKITKKLKDNGYSIGKVTSVEVTKRSEAGSVLELSISDGSKTVVLKKENM
jgi:stage II sporulation protein D